MVLKPFLLATGLALGTMAQTTSVMDLFLNTEENDNSTYQGSIISAAPEATTYAITRLPENCTEESWWRGPCTGPGDLPKLTRTYVNGPSTYARNLTEADAITWDAQCNISGQDFDCEMTFSASGQEDYETMAYVLQTSSSLIAVTITAGLEKILAVSTTTSGTAQTAASASSGPSETSVSASATSASSSVSTPSTTSSGAATEAIWDNGLAAFCGAVALALSF